MFNNSLKIILFLVCSFVSTLGFVPNSVFPYSIFKEKTPEDIKVRETRRDSSRDDEVKVKNVVCEFG